MTRAITTYIAIGANIGQPRQQVKLALEALKNLEQSSLIAQSGLYLTPPMGNAEQNDYINAVAKLTTRLTPIKLLDQLQAIEKAQGRVRKNERWAPRCIDLDILLYGEHCVEQTRLKIPHYGMKQRAFVLIPLAEIDPELVLPDNSRLSELLSQVSTQRIKKL